MAKKVHCKTQFARKRRGRRRRRKQWGRGAVADVAADLVKEGAKQAGSFALKKLAGAAAGGPVGMAIQAFVELGGRALEKAIKADWTQSKRREFKKAYKPVRNKRTGRGPNWLTGGWYAPRKNPEKNRYDEDYGFGQW